jgi:hypothetical protein
MVTFFSNGFQPSAPAVAFFWNPVDTDAAGAATLSACPLANRQNDETSAMAMMAAKRFLMINLLRLYNSFFYRESSKNNSIFP